MRIVRVDSLEGFRALRGDWEELYEASRESNPFLTWAWLANWAEHLAKGFVALVLRHDDRSPLEAAAFFALEEPGRWGWIDEHSYRPGVLARPGRRTALRPFLRHVALRECDVRSLNLHRSPAHAAYESEVQRALGPFAFFCLKEASEEARIVATDKPFEEYLASRPTKVRHELKRKVNKFERTAPGISLRELPDDADGQRALAVIEAVENRSWKAASNTAIVCSENERKFYERVFRLRSARTRGRLFFLAGSSDVSSADCIGYVLGVQHDDVYYALKTSFREDYAALSPGQVLFQKVIEHFCEHDPGVRSLELLGTDSRWKRELATSGRPECCYEIARPSALGLLRIVAKRHVLPALRAAETQQDGVRAKVLAAVKTVRRAAT